MKNPVKISKKGFSLAEVMVVVAILAILATIAIPSYRTFQARARQKEGFALLNQYFQAAHTSRAQYGYFPGNLIGTGFRPFGMLGYRLRAEDNTAQAGPNVVLNDNGCFRTAPAEPCNCGGMCNSYRTWIEDAPGVVGVSLGIGNAVVTCPAPMTSDIAFTVNVSGIISLTSMNQDNHQVNERKVYTNCSDGVN